MWVERVVCVCVCVWGGGGVEGGGAWEASVGVHKLQEQIPNLPLIILTHTRTHTHAHTHTHTHSHTCTHALMLRAEVLVCELRFAIILA